MSRMWMCHVTHCTEFSHKSMASNSKIFEWVMSRMWMSHVTYVYEPCHTCDRVKSQEYGLGVQGIWMSLVTYVNESCRTCKWAMSHMWMSPVTHVNEPCPTCDRVKSSHKSMVLVFKVYEWVLSRLWINHVTPVQGSCYKRKKIGHDSSAQVTWLVRVLRAHVWTCHVVDYYSGVLWRLPMHETPDA